MNTSFNPLSEKIHFSYIFAPTPKKQKPQEPPAAAPASQPVTHLQQVCLRVKEVSISCLKEKKGIQLLEKFSGGRIAYLKNDKGGKLTPMKEKSTEVAIHRIRECEWGKLCAYIAGCRVNLQKGFQKLYMRIKEKRKI